MRKHFVFALCLLMVLCFPGCAREEIPEAATLPPVATEVVLETTAQPQPMPGALLADCVSGQVCIGITPKNTGNMQYAILPDQEAALAAYQQAVSNPYSGEWYIKGDEATGLTVWYRENCWEFMRSGELVYCLGRVKAQDAAPLYELCAAAARDLGWQEAVRPEHLKGITAAALSIGGQSISLTEPEKLQQLESLLSGSTKLLMGAGCPFGAELALTLADGKDCTIALATDSCGTWRSQGVYFEFGSVSKPLFDLFGIVL